MSAPVPTGEQAAASIAEAGLRETQVRRADVQLAWALGILAGAALVVGVLMSVAPHAVGPAVLAIYLAAIVTVGLVLLRASAYSRAGLRVFTIVAALFTTWNALTSAVSVATKWWAPTAPSYHLGVTEAIAVLPLLFGTWLLARRRI